ncbi:HD-GYP domain-containing protein [Colwelliaceae bacterium 6471]
MIRTISIEELVIGMYVKDVTWANSAYKVKTQGLVKSQKIINQLKDQGVVSLVVEDEPAINTNDASTSTEEPNANVQALADKQPTDKAPLLKLSKIKPRSLEDEFSQSCDLYANATDNAKEIFDDINSGKPLNAGAINAFAGAITESVIRNEYAMAILTRIRDKSTYQWEHAINCAILMCGFSLYLGLKKETAAQITLGAILHDIGNAKVSQGILNKPTKLTENDISVIQKHVMWGYDACKKDGLTNKIVTDIIINHHERLDGSGYPRKIGENKLSKLARMIAIVDVYDAMTGDKPYKAGEQPVNAFRYLMAKNNLFDRALVQQFIKYLGIHPVGSLVKLSDEKLAIVIKGNRDDPMKPLVKVFYNLKHTRYITSVNCDLAKDEKTTIVSPVRPDDYKINIARMIREII